MTASSRSVLRDLASFHGDVRVRFDVDLPASRNRDVLSFDLDGPVLFHGNARVAGLEQNLVAGVEGELLADLDLVVLSNLDRRAPGDLKLVVFPDARRAAAGDRHALVLADVRGAAASDGDRLVF